MPQKRVRTRLQILENPPGVVDPGGVGVCARRVGVQRGHTGQIRPVQIPRLDLERGIKAENPERVVLGRRGHGRELYSPRRGQDMPHPVFGYA